MTQADAALRAAILRGGNRAQARLCTAAASLDAMSPLAVLGRGYAVCWDATKQTILRDAAAVVDGASVRVTLHRGELDCTVRGRSFDAPESRVPSPESPIPNPESRSDRQ